MASRPPQPKGTLADFQREVEKKILGALLAVPSPERAEMVSDVGLKTSFWTKQHRPIIEVILTRHRNGEGFDDLTVIEDLRRRGQLEEVGGEEYIRRLIAEDPSTSMELFTQWVRDLRRHICIHQIRDVLQDGLRQLEQGRNPYEVLQAVYEATVSVSAALAPDRPLTVGEVLEQLDRKVKEGLLDTYAPIPTGFSALDAAIGGGIKPGELILVGGAQGVGKTIMCLQMARNIAMSGKAKCLYICYEHDEEYLLNRLIAMESVDPHSGKPLSGIRAIDLRRDLLEMRAEHPVSLRDFLMGMPAGQRVLENIRSYAERLQLIKASASRTTLNAIRGLAHRLKADADGHAVLFVDYLQKVAVFPESMSEIEKVTRVAEGLKDIALSVGIPVVAIVAAEREGLKAQRLHLYHFRGGSALDYECDIALVLNDKYKLLPREVLASSPPARQEEYKSWVVVSIEKNRAGRKMVDIEFRKRFEYYCFDPVGRIVQERLIE